MRRGVIQNDCFRLMFDEVGDGAGGALIGQASVYNVHRDFPLQRLAVSNTALYS